MQHESKRSGVAIEAKPLAGVRVIGDRTQLVSALENLVSNAIRFTPAGRSVTISLGLLPHAIGLEVADEGPGISDEDRQNILSGKWEVFTGPIKGQDGKIAVPKGKSLNDGEMLSMSWFVEGVDGTIPK